MHTPVLLSEVLQFLEPHDGGVYVDCTVGMGGHAHAILEQSHPTGQLIGLDCDAEALKYATALLQPYRHRVSLIDTNFARLGQILDRKVDGILMDLGVSSYQLDSAERGFGFQQNGPLDMRMDLTLEASATDVVQNLPEAELAHLIWEYGEEKRARQVAHAIVKARSERPICTTIELAKIVRAVVPRTRHMRIDPATRTFQALRIYVNSELASLKSALDQAVHCLKPGGKLCVISFHSLEDRIAKQTFRHWSRDCICPPKIPVCRCDHQARLRIVTKRPVGPQPNEVTRNPRSRSARLRVAVAL